MQAKEIERLNGVYKKLLRSNGVDMYGKALKGGNLYYFAFITKIGIPVWRLESVAWTCSCRG